ncbi:YheC/YheD family endospore coat-associated protein [Paenibacillus sp. Root444D2]|uniref:YheC/YheD family endospore coat-associated protein n=1 Tax=Paenibacillus sp. Root444D2 TaxID=1736538 RepID=UPI001F18E2EF|nr:YheC/YheD family protein [Paenibacillus sp. Root444D2]
MMDKGSGLVGIMVANQYERKYALQKYLNCNTTHMKLFCFTPDDIDWKRNSISGIHRINRKWLLSKFPFPDVVYNRCYRFNPKIIERLGKIIGRDKCFNHINQFNKHEIHIHLSQWLAQYLPETILYDRENVLSLLDTHKVLYVKPCYGNKGKSVYRVEVKDSKEIHIGEHHFSPKIIVKDPLQFQVSIDKLVGSTPYIIQKGVDIQPLNEQVFDIRVLAQKNKRGQWSATNVISRLAHKGFFNTSMCEKVCLSEKALKQLYPPDKVNEIIRSIYDISLRAAEIIEMGTHCHLGELSVDLVLDSAGFLWIIEVNGKPQKELYDEIDKRDRVYKRPLEYARYLRKK